MLPVYLGCLALGGLLIIASVVMGGKDLDKDVSKEIDLSKDVDLDGHELDKAETGTWLPFLSLRFWTFALATFGLAGSLLSLLGFSDPVSAPSSALTGIFVGWAVAWAFRRLSRERVTGDIGLRQIAGKEGRLLLPVGPERTGKVRVVIDGQDVDLPARTGDDRTLELKQQVLVVRVVDGVAEVTSVEPGRHKRVEAAHQAQES